jgi:hypothetical protein
MTNEKEIFRRASEACARRACQMTKHCLCVQIGEQKLYHFIEGVLAKVYIASTSLLPPSCIENSHGTPTGLHAVADKIGNGAPAGMVFIGRQPTGKTWPQLPTEENRKNLITTRILRLRGLEPGLNAGPGRDSYDRYIYIHGTNHPEKLGTPASAGCVQLSDVEVLEVFARVPEGSLLWVE